MVGHETVGVASVAVALLVAGEAIEIGLVIPIVVKRLSSLVATDDYVVEQSWNNHSGRRAMGRIYN